MGDSLHQGGKFYISETAQETDLNQAAFEGLTWVEVENLVNIPELAISENIIERQYIDTDIVGVQKGLKVGNESSLELGFDSTLPGQAAVRTASATKFKYPIKRELNDIAAGGSTNTIIYSRALITQPMLAGGGAEDEANDTFTIKIAQVPIRVLAT